MPPLPTSCRAPPTGQCAQCHWGWRQVGVVIVYTVYSNMNRRTCSLQKPSPVVVVPFVYIVGTYFEYLSHLNHVISVPTQTNMYHCIPSGHWFLNGACFMIFDVTS